MTVFSKCLKAKYLNECFVPPRDNINTLLFLTETLGKEH